jgi:hypothetical protein
MYRDRVLETSTSTGTTAFVLAGTITGRRTFLAAFGASSQTVAYCIEGTNTDGTLTGEWEVGTGTFNGSTGLTRTTVLASSNAGALVPFSSGSKNVFDTAPAAYLVPQGTDKSVAFNDAGLPGSNASFTYDKASNTATFGNITGSALAMTIQPIAPTTLQNGGTLTIQAQAATAATRTGGALVIAAGAGNAAAGGAVTISSGTVTSTGAGGAFTINVGASLGSTAGSAFTVNGASSVSGNGGALTFNGGASSSLLGGSLNFNSGAGGSGTSGNLNFTSGTGASTGNLVFKSSISTGAGGNSGFLQLATGNGVGGTTGSIDARTGNVTGTAGQGYGIAGNVQFIAGNSTSADGGDGGSATFIAGNGASASGNGGSVSFTAGDGYQAGFLAGSMYFTFGNAGSGADISRLYIAKTGVGGFGVAPAANAVSLGTTGPVAGLTVTKWIPVTLDGVNGYIPFFS